MLKYLTGQVQNWILIKENTLHLLQILPMMLVMSSLVVPLITADQALMPEAGEAESFQSLVTMDKNNHLCAQRLNEIVDDFVRWGII